jgi:hypothetical protein
MTTQQLDALPRLAASLQRIPAPILLVSATPPFTTGSQPKDFTFALTARTRVPYVSISARRVQNLQFDIRERDIGRQLGSLTPQQGHKHNAPATRPLNWRIESAGSTAFTTKSGTNGFHGSADYSASNPYPPKSWTH